jgi:hypothetical protein
MKNTITIQDNYNSSKTVEFKQSKCYHFYQRQLLDGNPITNWQRAPKKSIQMTMSNFTQGTLLN